jgi:hypothetical protein
VYQNLFDLRFRDVVLVDMRLAGLAVDVVTDFHGASVFERRLTFAISGGARSARRLLTKAIGTCLQFLQAA